MRENLTSGSVRELIVASERRLLWVLLDKKF